MRTLWWIFITLLRRSWLIVAGVILGLIARTALPTTTGEPGSEILNPAAKAQFDREWAPFESQP
jgi:hypothetical protein